MRWACAASPAKSSSSMLPKVVAPFDLRYTSDVPGIYPCCAAKRRFAEVLQYGARPPMVEAAGVGLVQPPMPPGLGLVGAGSWVPLSVQAVVSSCMSL